MYPILYNRFSSEFRDKHKKINTWKIFGSIFGLSGKEAEDKYKSIRTSYGRHFKCRRKIKSGSGTNALPRPSQFDYLDWLNIYIEHKDTSTNFQTPLEDVEEFPDGIERILMGLK